MPHEFWREVVDRVAAEVPGTLLLAEAFWLMEGYFVRTLGMHRVYNSAFMNMLRDEDNAKYRSVIKNTIEFDPDIMKRYVNFMSNPDERTAIDQFGKGDKCFGVAVMMSTLPGLPMFGHGQIEGFTEKYGMEYRWPRYEENPDHGLVERHEREIAPLLKRRWLFAESENFLLYDLFTANGTVDENVFAYSNRNGGERALVVYNNRYGTSHGTIDYSAAYADKGSGHSRQRRLAEGLGLSGDRALVVGWRDSLTGLEYLKRAEDVIDRGLTLELHAYQSHVFMDFRELRPTVQQPWDKLSDWLNGRGVPNLGDELVNLELRPMHDALRRLLDPTFVLHFADLAEQPRAVAVDASKVTDVHRNEFLAEAWPAALAFLTSAQSAYLTRLRHENQPAPAKEPASADSLQAAYTQCLRAALRMPVIESLFSAPWTAAARRVLPSPSPQLSATSMWGPVLAWCVLERLAVSIDPAEPERMALDLFDRLRLRVPLGHALAALGFEGEEAWRVAARIKVLLLIRAGIGKAQQAAAGSKTESREALPTATANSIPEAASHPAHSPAEDLALPPDLWSDPDVRWLTGAHEAEGYTYIVQERYEELLWWLLMPSLLQLASKTVPTVAAAANLASAVGATLATAKAAGYRVEILAGTARSAVSAAPPASEAEVTLDELGISKVPWEP